MCLRKFNRFLNNFRITVLVIISLSLLLTGCISTPPSVPSQTAIPPTKTEVPPTVTPVPPTATQISLTNTPQLPTPTSTQTPSISQIDPQNASELSVVQDLTQVDARSFTWLAQSTSLALGTQKGVEIYSSPNLIQSSVATTGTPNFLINAPDQSQLAWATQENVIQLWNVSSSSQPQDLNGNTGPVTSLAFSPDGKYLASASYDSQIFLWNNGDTTSAQTWDIPFWASNLSFSPDETEVAGVNLPEFEIQIWKSADGEPVRKLSWSEHASPALYGAFFSPDWSYVAWTARGTVQLMSVGSGNLGPTLNHEDFVNGVAWSPDSSLLAVATAATLDGKFQPVVVIWNAPNGDKVTTLPQNGPTLSLQFSPDGHQFATLSSDGTLQVWAVQK